MRIAWFAPLVLLGLSACVNVPPDNKTTVVNPAPTTAPAMVMPAPGTTVITHP